jgi:hypothetical protein
VLDDYPELAAGKKYLASHWRRGHAAMMRTKATMATGLALVLLGAAVASALIADRALAPDRAVAKAAKPAWTETQWPFPMDEWGQGKAFVCKAEDCGVETRLYVRAKIGFCNCTTGVSDDEELDRLTDFRLMGDKLVAAGSGRAVDVAWMKGRSRAYLASDRVGSALAVAFNDRCDAIVATVVVANSRPLAIESGVLEFLNGPTIRRWAEVTLGL